ncbi:MAG: hydrogenase formation protein HypD [Magnetococcales bacterium]|nr:hydrogenase formation protein HypD [Magnetococcales bacterium]
MSELGKKWLAEIHALKFPQPVALLNVCGGHERSLVMAGLRSVLPKWVTLIPGPGCPVCVCPEKDIAAAIRLAMAGKVVAAFGDMLRVPVQKEANQPRSLEEARAAGGTVVPVASPTDAVALAHHYAGREVVFLAAGFETTMAPVAAALAGGVKDNFSLLLAGRLTWPVVAMLLAEGKPGFDGLILPGHVCTITGMEEWSFVPEKHGIPCAVAGFLPELLLESFHGVLQQLARQEARLLNCYPQAVRPGGNSTARRLLAEVFQVVDAPWRGVGMIAASGYALQSKYSHLDGWQRYASLLQDLAGEEGGKMPAGCGCAQVVLGKLPPDQCLLYGRGCTPAQPVGPCMVSDEGACRIWWRGGVGR